MNIHGILIAGAGLAGAAWGATPTPTPAIPSCPANILAYHVYWKTSIYPSSAIPYNKLTHIAHAFVLPRADGTLNVDPNYLDPNLNSLAAAAGVKVLVSVGGQLGADDFDILAASPAARTAFATELEAFIRANNYQGLDLDWEFPLSVADRANYNLMVQEIRQKFDASPAPAPSWLITMATPATDWYGRWFDFAVLKNYVSFFNVMAYPFHGGWENHSGHNAPLFHPPGDSYHSGLSGSSSLSYYTGTRGVPAGQIHFGVPFYGREFTTEDIHDPCAGGCEIGGAGIPYYTLAPKLSQGWTRTFDAAAASPILRWDTGPGVITYDDPQSIAQKVEFALEQRGVAGVFMWALYQDYLGPGNQPLLDAMHDAAACGVLPAATQTALALKSESAPPTATPTQTPSPGAEEGQGKLLRALAVPNPNPGAVHMELSGAIDVVQLTLFSTGMSKVLKIELPCAGKSGWLQLPLGPEALRLPNGSYYYSAVGFESGRGASRSVFGRLTFLR